MNVATSSGESAPNWILVALDAAGRSGDVDQVGDNGGVGGREAHFLFVAQRGADVTGEGRRVVEHRMSSVSHQTRLC